MIEIRLSEDYTDSEVPMMPDIIVVGETPVRVELDDACTDPLRIIKELCEGLGSHHVSIPASVMARLVDHPLVQYHWDLQKFVWTKVEGEWSKSEYTFNGDTVLNFQGVDWFI